MESNQITMQSFQGAVELDGSDYLNFSALNLLRYPDGKSKIILLTKRSKVYLDAEERQHDLKRSPLKDLSFLMSVDVRLIS